MTTAKEIEEFVTEQREALLSLDEAKIRAYAQKYHVRLFEDPEIFWGSIHKARMVLASIPAEEKAKSRAWLIEHGMSPGVRGIERIDWG